MNKRRSHRRRHRPLVLQRSNGGGAIQVNVEFTGIASVQPLLRSDFATCITRESIGVHVRDLEGQIEVARGVGRVSDFHWLDGAGDVEVVLASGAVVAPAVAAAAAGVAAEDSAGVGGGDDEGEDAAAVGGVGDEVGELGA